MKRIYVIVFVLLFFFNATIFVSANGGIKENFDYSNPVFRATVDMLNMEGHGNDDYSSCNVKQLYYQEVVAMFEKGMTKQEILDYYVKAQGVSALKAPPKKGFNLTLWTTPILLIVLGTILLYFLIRKWKKNNPVFKYEDESQFLDTESEIYSSLIEAERKKFL
jgi:cytochrome c-type biogenesis protein CcmH